MQNEIDMETVANVRFGILGKKAALKRKSNVYVGMFNSRFSRCCSIFCAGISVNFSVSMMCIVTKRNPKYQIE